MTGCKWTLKAPDMNDTSHAMVVRLVILKRSCQVLRRTKDVGMLFVLFFHFPRKGARTHQVNKHGTVVLYRETYREKTYYL